MATSGGEPGVVYEKRGHLPVRCSAVGLRDSGSARACALFLPILSCTDLQFRISSPEPLFSSFCLASFPRTLGNEEGQSDPLLLLPLGETPRSPRDAGLVERLLQLLQIDLDQLPQPGQLLGELLGSNAIRLALRLRRP